MLSPDDNCTCAEYGDIQLEDSIIRERENIYKEMAIKLRQISQKSYDPYLNHFRLYICDYCGCYWQASISRVSQRFYLYKVPKIKPKDWKIRQYISPTEIIFYNEIMGQYISKNSHYSNEICSIENCNKNCLHGLKKCCYHQIKSLQKIGSLPNKPTGEWFLPYKKEMLITDTLLK